MKQHATYIFDCGCLIPEHKLLLDKHHRRRCPNHHNTSKLLKRTSFCKICGKYIEQLSNRGSMATMCNPCKKEYNRQAVRARKTAEKAAYCETYDNLSETHKPVIRTRRTDCKHYLKKCLPWYFLRDKKANCDGCKLYEYLELDPMDYAFSNK